MRKLQWIIAQCNYPPRIFDTELEARCWIVFAGWTGYKLATYW